MLRIMPLVLLVACLLPGPAQALTFTPSSFDDAPDNNVGDGICASTLPGKPCTLRAAIQEANTTVAADTVLLNGGTYTLSIPGAAENASATGDLDVSQSLNILPGTPGVLTTIDGGGLDRVLHVIGGDTFNLSGVIIRNGAAIVSASYSGGGLLLTNAGDNLIAYSLIEDNVANNGGGLFIAGAGNRTRIWFSILRRNQANGNLGFTNPEGNAIRVFGDAELRLEQVSVYDNSLIGSGSGELAAIAASSASLTAFSSTIDGDSHRGISTYNSNVVLGNVSITDNAVIGLRWGRFSSAVSVGLFMRNSIVAGNGQDCNLSDPDGGAIDIDGHNIDSDGGCGLSAAPAYGNLIHVPLDWMLGPLNTNALLPARFPFPDGPAHDTGSPLDTTLGNPEACFRYDQLGVDRSSNGPCDIGAVEAVHLFGNGFEGIII